MSRDEWDNIKPDAEDAAEMTESLAEASPADVEELRRMCQRPVFVWMLRWCPGLEAWHFRRKLRYALQRLAAGQDLTSVREPLAALVALVMTQAKTDRAEFVTFYADESKMTYRIDGVDYEMVPPPKYVLAVACRMLVRLAGRPESGCSGLLMIGENSPISALRITPWVEEGSRRVEVRIAE